MVSYKALNTIAKRSKSDARHAVGYRNARQSAAITKRSFSDAGDAVGYRDARQSAAVRKRIIPNAGHATWNLRAFAAYY